MEAKIIDKFGQTLIFNTKLLIVYIYSTNASAWWMVFEW